MNARPEFDSPEWWQEYRDDVDRWLALDDWTPYLRREALNPQPDGCKP